MDKIKNTLPILILRTARPRQWMKNFALYAALIFSGFFFYNPSDAPSYFQTVTTAFVIFSLLASSIYIINDIIDADSDRKHPFKKKRPIASGKLSVPIAIFTAITLIVIVFFTSFWLSDFFKFLLFAYFLLQILYAKYTKHIAILDVVSIATGFLIRIYAGAVVVNLHMSVWFLLTVVSASLFLAVGKRQSERTLLQGYSDLGSTRKTLKRYSQRLLDQYTGMFANATWLTYALFTFQNESIHPPESLLGLYGWLPRSFQSTKLLMATVPLVIFGVMRYLQLVYESNQGESPEKVLTSDKPLLMTGFFFLASVMFIIYGLS
ncbi:MAG: decaprenyl-phosphate phosphoribosyltransferase [Candidatus Pacebacteria bacterium]|nr:decaprenyl-phosphate phosphoribosyltransferase [Candidatus Paceibacterota bacterium]